MKALLIILFLAAATAQAQDTTYHTDFTEQEMEELIAKDEKKVKVKKTKVKKIVNTVSPQVQQYMNQDPQDYRNFYYRKTKRKLFGFLSL